MRQVINIAKRYRRGGRISMSDLYAEGCIGVIEAARRFEMERGFRFTTYARWWIEAKISDFVRRNRSLIKPPSSPVQKRAYANLARAREELRRSQGGREPGLEDLAGKLGIPEQDVIVISGWLAGDKSLSATADYDPLAVMADERCNTETDMAEQSEYTYRMAKVDAAMLLLTPREQEIVRARRLEETPLTLEELSSRFGVSRERIRQIEMRAFEKLSGHVHQSVGMDSWIHRFAKKKLDSGSHLPEVELT
jgi:RNA polymerase sigma-32 factor